MQQEAGDLHWRHPEQANIWLVVVGLNIKVSIQISYTIKEKLRF